MYISQYMYGYSASAVKLSLLAFYWRIFPTKFVRWGVYVLSFCCLGWFVAIMVGTTSSYPVFLYCLTSIVTNGSIQITNLLECQPISFFWTQSGDGSCSVDPIVYFKYNSLANTFVDLFTLCLPIHEVLRLQMSNTKKIVVIGVFAIGSLYVLVLLAIGLMSVPRNVES